MPITCRNCGTGHAYRIDGEGVTGVTTLIKGGFPAPGLIGWTGRVVAEYVADAEPEHLAALRAMGRDPMISALRAVPFENRNKASLRGTAIHGFAERLSRGEQLCYGDAAGEIPEEHRGLVEACLAFLDEWRVDPVLIEAVVGNRWVPYAGTLDLVADVPGYGRVLLDYKTTASGIWPETALQLAAYRYADVYAAADGTEIPMAYAGIEATWAVWLRADGYDVIPIDTGPDRDTSLAFQAFRAAAYIARRATAPTRDEKSPIQKLIGAAIRPPRKAAAA